MSGRPRFCTILAVVGLLATGLSACGSPIDPDLDENDFAPRFEPPPTASRGGELTVLASGDVGPLDPGNAINQATTIVNFASQRTLLAESPRKRDEFMPDLTAGMPRVKRAAGQIVVRLRQHVRFSPPVSRAVEARDVKYALERSLLPGVASGDTGTYLGQLEGFEAAQDAAAEDPTRAPEIAGLTVEGPHRLRFDFAGDVPPLALASFTLNITSPVPSEYAREFDRAVPSTYGSHVVSTGPYRVEADDQGSVTGYRPGASLELERNINWSRATDFRPAYLDSIRVESGYTNLQLASKEILEGSGMINGDFGPTAVATREAAVESPDQLMVVPSPATLYASLNTTLPPFDDVNVRRAAVAATDRTAVNLSHGGELAGDVASHFLPPGMRGFSQAGGFAGPGFGFLSDPDGDLERARGLMRRAGYPSGRYDGSERPVMVTDNTGFGRKTGEIVRQGLESIGIDVTVRSFSRDTMYSSYCNVPSAEVAVCPNVGWVGLFGDGQTMLDPTFNGKRIVPINNSNWPQLDTARVNDLIERSAAETDPVKRAEGWARVDREVGQSAAAIPLVWPKINFVSSADVNAVIEPNSITPALPMISLDDCGKGSDPC